VILILISNHFTSDLSQHCKSVEKALTPFIARARHSPPPCKILDPSLLQKSLKVNRDHVVRWNTYAYDFLLKLHCN